MISGFSRYKSLTRKRMIALSIRQPFVEMILRGEKTIEYRTRPTKKRGRVYIYASKKPAIALVEANSYPATLPTGRVLGTVEIIGCSGLPGNHRWHLARPKRLKSPFKPKNCPQFSWFYPL